MTGKIGVSSGTEDLSSLGGAGELSAALESRECRNSLLSMFFPSNATKEQVAASLESVDCALPKPPTSGEGCECHPNKRPALASKVIDDKGNARITILYDGNQLSGGGDTGMFTGLIDAAAENDIVDITIMTTLYDFSAPKCNIFSTLSILSAIQRCKAKVITRAGCLCSISDCAVWLSGDDRRMSPMGWVAVRQPASCSGGTMKDAEFRAEDMKDQLKVFTDYVVDMGLLTEDEVTRMYEEQAIIGLSYDALAERLKSLKKA